MGPTSPVQHNPRTQTAAPTPTPVLHCLSTRRPSVAFYYYFCGVVILFSLLLPSRRKEGFCFPRAWNSPANDRGSQLRRWEAATEELHLDPDEAAHSCLTLTDYLLIPCDNLKETSPTNADSSWFTDDSYLKDENGNIVLGMRLQLLLKSWRQHLSLWTLWPNKLNYIPLLELAP